MDRMDLFSLLLEGCIETSLVLILLFYFFLQFFLVMGRSLGTEHCIDKMSF